MVPSLVANVNSGAAMCVEPGGFRLHVERGGVERAGAGVPPASGARWRPSAPLCHLIARQNPPERTPRRTNTPISWAWKEPGYDEEGVFNVAGQTATARTTCRATAVPAYTKRALSVDCTRATFVTGVIDAGEVSLQLTLTGNVFVVEGPLRSAAPA